MSEINVELGRASDAAIQLKKAEDGDYGTINLSFAGNESSPHSMSEWYSYFHYPLVAEGGIIDFWDARARADSSDWESLYGGETNMTVSGATYNTSTPKNFSFDGTNDNIVTDGTVSLGSRWSISIWMRHTGAQSAGYERLFGMTSYQFDVAEGTDGKLKFYDGGWSTVSGVTLDDGDWQHIVFTYDSGASAGATLLVYEDKVLDQTTGDGRTITSKTIYLGSQQFGGENWLGEIGQYILWGQVLTSSEVATLFDNDDGYFTE